MPNFPLIDKGKLAWQTPEFQMQSYLQFVASINMKFVSTQYIIGTVLHADQWIVVGTGGHKFVLPLLQLHVTAYNF